MSKIAVTGGAGFIGSNLVRNLISKGHDVIVVDDLSTGLLSNLKNLDCDFQNISVTDYAKLNKSISNCHTIFHLGARGSVPRSILNPISTHDVNATGTLNVLEVARSSGAHVIFSSSSSVYGSNTELPKDEKMWLAPMTPYAASKLSAEGYVQAYASTYNVPTTLLRFFNVFGPRQRPDHEYAAVLPKWIWRALQNQPIEVFGDGTASRDFTYVDDVLDVAIMAMEKRILTNGAVNLAFGSRVTLNEVISTLKSHFPNLEVKYTIERPGDVKNSQNNPSKLMEFFPNIISRNFEDALTNTIDWLKDNGKTLLNGPRTID